MNYYYIAAGAIALAAAVGMVVAIITYDDDPVRLSPVDDDTDEDVQDKKFDLFSSVRPAVAAGNWDEFVDVIRAMPDSDKIPDSELKLFWDDLRAGKI